MKPSQDGIAHLEMDTSQDGGGILRRARLKMAEAHLKMCLSSQDGSTHLEMGGPDFLR